MAMKSGDNPLPRKRKLRDAQDLKRFMADLINRANRGEIDQGQARCLGYLVQTMSSILQISDIEVRLEALEEKQDGK